MKIKCDLTNKFFTCYSEARGVAGSKRKILKTKKVNKMNYFTQTLLIYLLILLLCILMLFLKDFCFCMLSSLIVLLDVIYLSFEAIKLTILYDFRKKMKFKSIVILDEDGLTDTSYYGIKMVFGWDKIKAVVIKKNSVTILTNTPCFFYFDIKQKDNILEAVDKYSKKVLIVE